MTDIIPPSNDSLPNSQRSRSKPSLSGLMKIKYALMCTYNWASTAARHRQLIKRNRTGAFKNIQKILNVSVRWSDNNDQLQLNQ